MPIPEKVRYAVGAIDSMLDNDYERFADMDRERLSTARLLMQGDDISRNAFHEMKKLLKKAHDEAP